LPAAVGIAATTPHTLHLANAVGDNPAAVSRLGDVAAPVLVAAVAAGLVVALAGALELRRPIPERVARTGTRIAGVALAVIALAGLVGGLAVLGNPAHRARTAWHEFKDIGVPDQNAAGHIGAGFGGARYDYYRVAL